MQVFQLSAQPLRKNETVFTADGRSLTVGRLAGFVHIDTAGVEKYTFVGLDDYASWGYAVVRDRETVYVQPPRTVGLWRWDTRPREVLARDLETGQARAIAVAPDRQALYLGVRPDGAADRTEIWEFDTTELKRRAVFGGHSGEVSRLVVSADGRRIAGYTGAHVRVWDVANGNRPNRALAAMKLRDSLSEFALSADGAHLVTTDNRGVTVWNTNTGKEVLRSGKHRRAVDSVACSPTRPTFVTGDNAGNVFLWDIAGPVLTRFDWGLSAIIGLAFAPDGLRCGAVDQTGKVVIWDVDA